MTVPTLLLFGALDNRVSLQETEMIFENLRGVKTLKVYQSEGHDVYSDNEVNWANDVDEFLTMKD